MKSSAACAALAALFACAAHAADATTADSKGGSQQSKFAACAHESKGLRGEEHQKFMSECLKSDRDEPAREPRHAASEPGAQQNRMRSCNEEAGRKNLHGDERRAFMSACLKR